MKPIIGISANISPPDDPKRSFSKGVALHHIQGSYIRFVVSSGGTPILLPVIGDPNGIRSVIDRLDGLIVTGGVDLDPRLYGEENTHSLGVNRERDDFEIELINAARSRQLPLLCICRGIQVLNVALGGTLYQDIPTAIKGALKHTRKPEDPETMHMTRLTGRSFLNDIFDREEFEVNSSHHQSVRVPGRGLEVVSRAPDGVVEAVQCRDDRCTVGVQWHPERLHDDRKQVGLGKWFVKRAAGGDSD